MVDKPESDPSTNQPRAEASLLQLRLHHFFALTAVAAVLLAIFGPQYNNWGGAEFEPSRPIKSLLMVSGILYVLLLAIAITAVAYGIAWQRRGIGFFDQPGHWLLVEAAVIGLVGAVTTTIYRTVLSFDGTAPIDTSTSAVWLISLTSLVLFTAFPIALNIYIGRKKCSDRQWRQVFYVKALAKIVFGIGELITIVAVLVATKRDRYQGKTRDASHWLGVWLQIAFSGLNVMSVIVSLVNMYQIFSRM